MQERKTTNYKPRQSKVHTLQNTKDYKPRQSVIHKMKYDNYMKPDKEEEILTEKTKL